MAEATGTNGTGSSKSGFHILLNAFTHGTGKCRRYLTASNGYMETRLIFPFPNVDSNNRSTVKHHFCPIEGSAIDIIYLT